MSSESNRLITRIKYFTFSTENTFFLHIIHQTLPIIVLKLVCGTDVIAKHGCCQPIIKLPGGLRK